MKFSSCLSLALVACASTTSAFVAPQQAQVSRMAPLEAKKKGRWGPLVGGAVVGWALATQIATAAPVVPETPASIMEPSGITVMNTQNNYPSTMLSLGAYQPEAGYDSLDFSLPSYKVEEISAPKEEPLQDPVQEEARVARKQAGAKAAAAKEDAKAQAFFAKQKAKTDAAAEREAIQARVAAGKQAMREAKLAAKQQ